MSRLLLFASCTCSSRTSQLFLRLSESAVLLRLCLTHELGQTSCQLALMHRVPTLHEPRQILLALPGQLGGIHTLWDLHDRCLCSKFHRVVPLCMMPPSVLEYFANLLGRSACSQAPDKTSCPKKYLILAETPSRLVICVVKPSPSSYRQVVSFRSPV